HLVTVDACKRYDHLLGNELRLCRVQAVSELALPRQRRHAAVRVDTNPAIELGAAGAVQPLRGGARGCHTHLRRQSHRAEGHDQGTAGVKALAAIHALAPFAYARSALSVWLCAAQRHRTVDNAWRISGSVAWGLRSRNAFAVMITPLRQ